MSSKTLVLADGAAYPPAALRRSVLIVEDDRDMRELLAQVLADEGYGVGTAEDGVGAIRYLRSHEPPEMILLDWRMPKSDGVDFRRLQQADAGLSQIPVVLMTGDLRVEDSSGQFGVAELLIKPIEVDRLLEVVSRYVGPPPGRQ